MPLNLEDKKALVAEVNAVAAKAQSVVAAEYRGLTVTQMTDLRAKARAQGVYMRVVKNTLARKALVGTAFETIGAVLKGPLVLAFSKDDPGAAARVVKDFAKGNEKLVATHLSLGGSVLPGKDIEKLAQPAHTRSGDLDAARCHEGTHRKVRPHPQRAAGQVGPHARRRTRPETGRGGRLISNCLETLFGDPTWPYLKTKSSIPFPR